MVHQFNLDELRDSLDSRQNSGSNTVLIRAVKTELDGPANVLGDPSLLPGAEFAQFNEPCWKYVDAVLQEIRQRKPFAVVSLTWSD